MEKEALFRGLADEILGSGEFAACKNFIQHGAVTVYTHSYEVAAASFAVAYALRKTRFGAGIDLRSLVRAALLHDFFLYDWHKPENMWSLHGWTHPVTAAENARKVFAATDKEYSLIRTHMWPFTLFHPPQYREGWIICLADKVCSLRETLFRRGPLKFPAFLKRNSKKPAGVSGTP
jgi:uncharacterized protein